jgi:hypothetical protein
MAKIVIQRWWCTEGFSYDVDELKQWLATLDPSPKELKPGANAKRGIVILYRPLGHNAAEAHIAGGILQLLHSPQHACNIVLTAYAKRNK